MKKVRTSDEIQSEINRLEWGIKRVEGGTICIKCH